MSAVEPANEPEGTPPLGIDPLAHAELQLENALLRAGVDLDTEQGKLVRAAQTGQVPDVEAIKRQWELVKPAAATPEPTPDPEPRIEGESNQGAERSALAATSVVEPNPMDLDPNEEAVREGRKVLEGAMSGTHRDAVATAAHKIFEAAGRGDQRVMVQNGPLE